MAYGLKSISIKDLRSIGDSGCVEFKPLTILVGKNSSGKSSFIRTFPLLKQSAEEQKSEPILWFGRRVDFGSFHEAVNHHSGNKRIEFGFDFAIQGMAIKRLSKISPVRTVGLPDNITVNARISLKESSTQGAQVSSVKLEFFGTVCLFEFDNHSVLSRLSVGDYVFDAANLTQAVNFDGIFPEIVFYKQEKVDQSFRFAEKDPIFEGLHAKIKAIAHHKAEERSINDIIAYLKVASLPDFKKSLEFASDMPSWKEKVNPYLTDERKLGLLWNNCVALYAMPLIHLLNQEIKKFASNISYVEPIRATAERYYRKQALKIDEVDARGENVALFIDSLHQWDKKRFSDWMNESFGLYVSATGSVGHIALSIVEEGKPIVNMADAGFGFSQMLPIIALLWSKQNLRSKPLFNSDALKTICIEQPELHLHPGYQAKLADLLAKYAIRNKESTSLFIETHSSTMINRIGEIIANGEMSPDDVQIILFDKGLDGITTTRKVRFDQDGVLQEWPYGFFEAE